MKQATFFKWMIGGGFPLLLALAVGVSLVLYYAGDDKHEGDVARGLAEAFRRDIAAGDLHDYVEILAGSLAGRRADQPDDLRTTLNYLESTLGPSNIGYTVEREAGAGERDILIAPVSGRRGSGEGVAIIASYLASSASDPARSAANIAALMALAHAFTGADLGRPVTFVLHPDAPADAVSSAGGARVVIDLDRELSDINLPPRDAIPAEWEPLAERLREVETQIRGAAQ